MLGGHDGTVHTASVERYNPQTALWESMRPLPHARSGLAGTLLFVCLFGFVFVCCCVLSFLSLWLLSGSEETRFAY